MIRTKPSSGDLSLFLRQLSFFDDSGLDLATALTIILEANSLHSICPLIKRLLPYFTQGKPFSVCLKETRFPPLIVGMISLGERTGDISKVIKHLADYYEYSDKISQEYKNALIYPLFIAVSLISVSAVSVTKVIPGYARIFRDNNIILPLPTRIMFFLYELVSRNFTIVLLSSISIIILLILLANSRPGRFIRDFISLHFFPFSYINKKIHSYRLSEVLLLCLKSGATVNDALALYSPIIKNKFIKAAIDEVFFEIEMGGKLSQINGSFFDPLLISMIKLAEQTGEVLATLSKTSEHLKKDIELFNAKAGRLMEPVLIAISGIFVGFVMFSLLLPSLKLATMF